MEHRGEEKHERFLVGKPVGSHKTKIYIYIYIYAYCVQNIKNCQFIPERAEEYVILI